MFAFVKHTANCNANVPPDLTTQKAPTHLSQYAVPIFEIGEGIPDPILAFSSHVSAGFGFLLTCVCCSNLSSRP